VTVTRERYLGLVAALVVGGLLGGLLSGAVMNYAPASPADYPVPRRSGMFNPRQDEFSRDPPETICAKRFVIVDDKGRERGLWSEGTFSLRSQGCPQGEGSRIHFRVLDGGADMWIEAEADEAERNAGIRMQATPDRAFAQVEWHGRILGEFKPQR
jgi:hypothetical protein